MKPHWLRGHRGRRDVPAETRKYHNQRARYEHGQLHVACWPQELADQCPICQMRPFERHLWYDSRAEAETAYRLDKLLEAGAIRAWQRGRPIVLVPKIVGVQRAITYTPDFEVQQPDGTWEVWEIKGAACVCRACRPLKPGQRRPRQLIAPASMLKIKQYRAQDARPLRIFDKKGRPIHV